MIEQEKTVDLTGPQNSDAAVQKLAVAQGTQVGAITKAVPKFEKVTYSSFKAEHALDGGSVIIHFFLPTRKVTEVYWKQLFAEGLNEVAQEHFQATAPRLVAKYTEELHSWWFKAQGYDHIIDLARFLADFFGKLERHMAPILQTQSRDV